MKYAEIPKNVHERFLGRASFVRSSNAVWQHRGKFIVDDEPTAAAAVSGPSMSRAELAAAVAGVVVCSLAGSAVSAGQTDVVLSMLGEKQ